MSNRKLESTDEVAIIHIYGQTNWHSTAAISGSRSGLVALHEAIGRAIETGSSTADVMADDGEGYPIVIMREGPDTLGERESYSGDRGLPYTDPDAADSPGESFWRRVGDVVRGDRGGRRRR